jgi:spoIIIJ-associated protein
MNQANNIKKILRRFFKKMGIEIEAEDKENEDGLLINLRPIDEKITSLLIGYRGENLQAIQHILRLFIRKQLDQPIKLMIDINDYRSRRLEAIKEMILDIAEKVKKTQRVELLRPMSAYERRMAHLVVKEIPGLATQSVGEEPNRRVIIRPENSE